MTDKEKIKEEIERRIEQCYRTLSQDLLERERNETNCCLQQYKEILQFIDSLPEEPASEDLEEEIDRCYKSRNDLMMTRRQFGELIHHFAEWQKKQDQETIELAEDHAMLADMMKEREEIMKDAVDATILDVDAQTIEFGLWPEKLLLDIKEGDKVKIIIIKEN